MQISPVVLFVYNRLEHTRATLEALEKNELAKKTDFFIYSDGPKIAGDPNVFAVRKCIREQWGFRTITLIERKTNYGLAQSIISGVSEVINKYGSAIIIEDDIVTKPFFLQFMNTALHIFSDRKDIFSISGMNFIKVPSGYKEDVYLFNRGSSWGWATWKSRWKQVDWSVLDYPTLLLDKERQKSFNMGGVDLFPMLKQQMAGEIDSWAIRWSYSHFVHHAYCLYPVSSLVSNIGFDNSGQHCGSISPYKPFFAVDDSVELNPDIMPDPKIVKRFQRYIYRRQLPSRIIRAIIGNAGLKLLAIIFKRK